MGALLASVLRFLCHFLSGITVWAGFADGMPVWLYSLIYNGLYMLPEFGILIATAIALGLLVDFRGEKLGAIKRNKNNFNHKPSSYEGGLFKRFFFDSCSKLWFSIIHCRVIIKVF